MNPATFPCPYCSSPLRIRDRAFVERDVECPECGEHIEVTLNRDQEPIARKAEAALADSAAKPAKQKKSRFAKKPKKKPASLKKSPAGKNGEAAKSPQPARKPLFSLGERFSGVPEVLFSPVGIAWVVAGCVGVILLIMAWPQGKASESDDAAQQVAEFSDQDPSPKVSPLEESPLPEAIPAPNFPNPKGDVVRQRLTELGGSIQNYVDRQGHFPQGTVAQGNQPVKDRFSWLAEVFVQTAGGKIAEPQWDQPWNDPLNDRFVRQQREPFLNPLLPQKVGTDRYPCTHFVGVAGIGSDAPGLPVNHPRAGIFGVNRITRVEDIKDGQANTMMVAGVSNQLGSWAAGGNPSMRAFTQEPYFQGPDGFGTGENAGMSVLMADGSVRFLSKNTDPAIVRGMAAMADGWPTEEAPPEKPGLVPSPQKSHPPEPPMVVQIPPQQVAPQKMKPPAQVLPPKKPQPKPPKPVDVPAALAVKIVKFEQVKNAPFHELLYQVEELCGVPIRRDADLPANNAELWNRPVSLRLKDTTVGQILEELLQKAQLRYTVEADHIQLHSAP